MTSGIATSVQRASLLPGPGVPSPRLVVRPAPLLGGEADEACAKAGIEAVRDKLDF